VGEKKPLNTQFNNLTIEHVSEKHNGFPTTWEVIHIKALELSCQIQILVKFTPLEGGVLA
jgi:hypothetical protein